MVIEVARKIMTEKHPCCMRVVCFQMAEKGFMPGVFLTSKFGVKITSFSLNYYFKVAVSHNVL